jgi:isopentenyldiphosphate isomerase
LVEDFYGLTKAWVISFPLTILLAGYVLVFYKSIIHWFLVSVIVYSLVGLIITVVILNNVPPPYHVVIGELVALGFMILLLAFRKVIYKLVVSISSKKLSMENNLNELIRTTNTFSVLFALFALSYVCVYFFTFIHKSASLTFIYQVYTTLIVVVSLYETIRVMAVRGNLLKEEWLPIVNEYGNEIGSTNYHTSMGNNQQKYLHPVVRVIVIEGNRIFLKKNSCKDDFYPDQWDNAICTHIRLKETVDECLKRAAEITCGLNDINPVFLANYRIENSCEYQYVHLFISCCPTVEKQTVDTNSQVKWWTIQQINAELESGIFTQNFLKEFELLMRSGLIDTGKCQCDCKLRDELLSPLPPSVS